MRTFDRGGRAQREKTTVVSGGHEGSGKGPKGGKLEKARPWDSSVQNGVILLHSRKGSY